MSQTKDPSDPKGLIRESYRIDGIGDAECRSILLDWALSLGPDVDEVAALRNLMAAYGDAAPTHPMTALLRQGISPAPAVRERRRRR